MNIDIDIQIHIHTQMNAWFKIALLHIQILCTFVNYTTTYIHMHIYIYSPHMYEGWINVQHNVA